MVNALELSKLLSKTSKPEEVFKNSEAVKFHADRFTGGQTDKLAKLCYQMIKLEEFKNEKQA
jgi:hypothetical protein